MSGIDARVTAEDVEALFQAILRRPVGNAQYIADLVASGISLRDLVGQLRSCEELRNLMRGEIERAAEGSRHRGDNFRVPQDLVAAPLPMRRFIAVGSCLLQGWADRVATFPTGCGCDLYLFGAELPERPPQPIEAYDFQLVQLPLRSLLHDGVFSALKQSDLEAHRQLLEQCTNAARHLLDSALVWSRAYGILTFVLPFPAPQQNSVGRLMPRYDLRNPVHFIERLNQAIAQHVASYANAYFFDLNEIMSTHGRGYIQEDHTGALNHGGYMADFDFAYDGDRLDPPHRLTEVYEERVHTIMAAAWNELVAMVRTVRQTDMVKLVVIDLDDTLWRGVAAELNPDDLPTAEGWPRGFWEALEFLKRRGILLGIISQNDEARIMQLWPRIMGNRLPLRDFAVRRIDWRPKSEKMAEVLAAVNLLPGSVLYIDDNPVQRGEIAAAFPGLRVLGGDPFTWRHILLWSAETQVARITREAANRTDMVQAQVKRENQRQLQPRAEFLASLNVRMTLFTIADVAHPRFARVLELINKTNQFNTTGERWEQRDFVVAFAAGMRIRAFDLADVHTEYGLVGVLLVDRAGIRQFVMSCRVLGLEAEIAAIGSVVALFAAEGHASITARSIETERNLPSRNVFERCGFAWTGDVWQRATEPGLVIPAHIRQVARVAAAA